MDSISEILKNIKDRLSSPFIFSYTLSWFIYNWQITIALLWYNPALIGKTGYTSIFDFINCKLTDSFWWSPFWWALGYTLIWPFIRMGFAWVQAKASTLSEALVRNATNETRISAKRYFQFKDEYEKQLKILQTNIDSEQVIKGELEKQTTELLKARQENISLTTTHSEEVRNLTTQLQELNTEKDKLRGSFDAFLKNLRDVDSLDGLWEISYEPNDVRYKARIDHGLMINLETPDDHYRIENYYHDTINKKLSFTMIPITIADKSIPDVPYSSYNIDYKDEPSTFVILSGEADFFQGRKELTHNISFTRIKK